MPRFEIRFRMAGPLEYSEDLVDAFNSRYDGLVAWHEGRLYATVEFDAVNGELESRALILSLEGVLAARCVEVDLDLVDIPEIASRAGRSRQSIQQLVTGKRRGAQPPFPEPMSVVGGKRIWDWGSVVAWLKRESLLEQDEPNRLTREQLYSLNTWLARRRSFTRLQHRDVEFVETIAPLASGTYWVSEPNLSIGILPHGAAIGSSASAPSPLRDRAIDDSPRSYSTWVQVVEHD